MNEAHHALRAALLLAAVLLAPHARADEFDDLRLKWRNRAASAPALPANDPDLLAQGSAGNAAAQQYWSAMDRGTGRTALWPDLPLGTVSANVTASFTRLNALAAAYGTTGSPLQGDPAVLAAVVAGLDWMVTHAYTASGTRHDNWWDWQIGAPAALNAATATLYTALTPAQVASYMAAIDYHMPDPTRRTNLDGTLSATVETGANRLDKAFVAVLRGILGKSSAKIAAGRDAIGQALAYVTSGDGFHADGSFVQHTHEPYVGAYGTVLVTNIARLYYLLNGSSWTVTDPNYLAPYDWAMRAFRLYLYDGAMMDNNRGRSIARQYTPDHVAGRGAIAAMAELAQVLPEPQAGTLKAMLKGQVRRDTSFGASYFTPVPTRTPGITQGVSAFDIALLKGILADDGIAAAPEPEQARYLPATDRAVQRRDGHAYAVSLFSSKRMSAFEYGNGENYRGWWTGMGMTYLYNGDLLQYGGNYWATVDMGRLAGTTTDRSGSGEPVAWKFYGNTKNTVGGAELDERFATVAMDFATLNVTGTTLAGKKAWFLFGDRVVAVGTGIASTGGARVETIVDNRALNAAGDNALTIDGGARPPSPGWSEAVSGAGWAHLEGNAAAADIAWVFPDRPVLAGLRETRTGSWRTVNKAGSTDSVSASYLSQALDHGVNPAGAAYTYIVLPNRTPQQAAAFAAANPVTVLERSTSAIAVRDSEQGLTGAIFWADTAKTVSAGGQPWLTSDRRAVVTVQQQGTDLWLAVADPTQANTGTINLELNRAAQAVVSADPAITVTQTTPTIRMAVAVNGSAGASYHARFTLDTTVALSPSADAFVRDGAYAATNYGTAAMLTVKEDAAGYRRRSVLKFDLSSLSGTIGSARLRLTPTSVGTASGIVHRLYRLAGDGWTETGITWNGLPAHGSLLGSWTVPTAGTAVEVDVTAAAAAVFAGSGVLALEVEAAANYGSAGSVDYAARENANAGLRPVLIVDAE
ncbi:polysaccharide lyase family 8 super-sandwich domain-containing protein [Pseudoduganella lutea]|nr:polysaccharide lyase family 8 super-sandwich domain-containing protein [Pseudoduganella lutea]